jgi:hypothetical protein
MCVIKKKCKQVLLLVVCCFWGLTSIAQDKGDIQRLEKKIDSVLALLQKDVVQVLSPQDTSSKDCTEEMKTLNDTHALALAKVNIELQKVKDDIDKLQKEKVQQQNKLEQSHTEYKRQIENILEQIMLGGSAFGLGGINYFLELAKLYKANNLQKMEAFVVVFNEVLKLEQEFNEMKDYEKVKSTAEVLKFKVAAYPGLHQEVLNLLFKIKNYCDYEQKLIDAIALSQTQSSEENRKKQLLRREDDFVDYPSLKLEIEKAKVSRDYHVTPKCKA